MTRLEQLVKDEMAMSFGALAESGALLPRRYAQGYSNANCVGCCKGGERWPLTALPEPKGPVGKVETPECSIFCAMAEEEF